MTADVHVLFALDEIESGSVRKVEIGDREIAIIRIDDDVYAIGDTCSHAEVSLSEGWVDADDCTIECVQHGAMFDVTTGAAITLPATRPVPTYDVAVVDGDVVLTIPSEPTTETSASLSAKAAHESKHTGGIS